MEQNVPESQSAPAASQFFPSDQPQITPDQLEEMKRRAKELAIQQTLAQRQAKNQAPQLQQQPQVVYVRRNLTVAELIIVLLLSTGILAGVQFAWKVIVPVLPTIEIKMK